MPSLLVVFLPWMAEYGMNNISQVENETTWSRLRTPEVLDHIALLNLKHRLLILPPDITVPSV